MLKYVINNTHIKRKLTDLEISKIAYENEDRDGISAESPCHKLRGSDYVYFNREDGDAVFSDKSLVTNSTDSNFVCNVFPDRLLGIAAMNTSSYDIYDIDDNWQGITDENVLVFFLTNAHTHIKNETPIRDKFAVYSPDNYLDSHYCDDEYVITGDGFLHQISGGKITSEIKNPTYSHSFYVVVDENVATALTEYSSRQKEYYSGDKYYLDNVLIFLDESGYDDETRIMWKVEDTNNPVYKYIKNNYLALPIYEVDERFYSGTTPDLTSGTTLQRMDGDIHLSLPLGELFATNLQQEDTFSNAYVNERIEASVNDIVDYEKRRFEAVIPSGDTFVDATGITINLHMRSRPYEMDGDERDYGEWDIADWLNMNFRAETGYTLTSPEPDLLGHIGFTDDDVYYQKNCLKKSFIRLMFYDTKDRRTQKLLFYSTMFFDTNKFFSKYIKRVISNNDKTPYVLDNEMDNDTLRMSASFECGNMYNDDKSSEGFYLYFFPNVVKGTEPTTLYMKVEFNHAKYGKTIPLTMPSTVPNGTYWRKDEGKVDMAQYLSDTYTEIKVKYDRDKNRYVWYFPKNDATMIKTRKITLDCYEAILNDSSFV